MSATLSLPVCRQPRHLHVLHLLIRDAADGTVRILVCPHRRWKKKDGTAYWSFPAKKTVVPWPICTK